MKIEIDSDVSDLVFRSLFCLIFVGLGAEHIFSDTLIQHLMPEWIPFKRAASLACGVWLVIWGSLIFLGWHLRAAAIGLAAFLVVVTAAVHLPGVVMHPAGLAPENYWMWEILQRTNLVKNICLLGVCFQLLHHKPGKYSLEAYLDSSTKKSL